MLCMFVCHLAASAVSYVRRSFSINNPAMDESDTDVSLVVAGQEGGSVVFV